MPQRVRRGVFQPGEAARRAADPAWDAIVAGIEQRFAARGWKMPAVNRRQAQVPRGATVLANPHGTAPGLWIEHGDAVIALVPGPPREMKPMIDGDVRARLQALAGSMRLHKRMIRVSGKGESAVEEIVQPIYSAWTRELPAIDTTILAGLGQVELHLSLQSTDAAAAGARLDRAVGELSAALGRTGAGGREAATQQLAVRDELERSPRPRIAATFVSTRGTGRLGVGTFARALMTVWRLRRKGRCDVLHINLASRGSTYRKLVFARLAARLKVPVGWALEDRRTPIIQLRPSIAS